MSRKVAGVQASGGNSGGGSPRKGGHNSGSIYNSQVNIHTGYYQNWKVLSKEDFKTAIAARKQNSSNSSQTASKKEVAETKHNLFELSYTLTKMKIFITAFSGKPQGTDTSEANKVQAAFISGFTGNYFGGRVSKRTKT